MSLKEWFHCTRCLAGTVKLMKISHSIHTQGHQQWEATKRRRPLWHELFCYCNWTFIEIVFVIPMVIVPFQSILSIDIYGQPCMRCGKARHPTPDKCPAGVQPVTNVTGKDTMHHNAYKTVAASWKQTQKRKSGAEVTVISEDTLKSTKLEKPSKVLYGPAHKHLEVVGQFAGSLKHGEHSYSGNIFVV